MLKWMSEPTLRHHLLSILDFVTLEKSFGGTPALNAHLVLIPSHGILLLVITEWITQSALVANRSMLTKDIGEKMATQQNHFLVSMKMHVWADILPPTATL